MTAGVAIVGAGPAGMSAAPAPAASGIRPVLIDARQRAGGRSNESGAAEPLIDRLRDRLAAASGLIDYRPGQAVIELRPGPTLTVRDGTTTVTMHVGALLLAGGSLEVVAPTTGWTLPGVFGITTLAPSRGLAGRLVIGGAGPMLWHAAAMLLTQGTRPAAVVDAAAAPRPGQVALMATRPGLLWRGLTWEVALRRARVPIFRRSMITAIEPGADGAAATVIIARVDRDWQPTDGAWRRIAGTAVAVGLGLRPDPMLTLLAGCRHEYDTWLGGWHAAADDGLKTTVANIWVAGDAAGVRGIEPALADGTIAAASIAERLGRVTPALAAEAVAARTRKAAGYSFRTGLQAWSAIRPGAFAACSGDTIVCPCESVTLDTLRDSIAQGCDHAEAVAERTGAGRGQCRGATCTPAILAAIAAATGREPHEIPPMIPRAMPAFDSSTTGMA